MKYSIEAIMNLEGDLASYNILTSRYNYNIMVMRNLLLKLGTNDLYTRKLNVKKLTETKEECFELLEEIEETSEQLINDMYVLDMLLESVIYEYEDDKEGY